MVEESGHVVAVEGNYAWVSVERRTACESCSVKKGCGTSVLSKVVGKKIATIKVDNVLNANVGDPVRIGIDDQAMIGGSALIYVLPLLIMFVFSILINILFRQESYTILAALAGLGFGFLLIKHLLASKSIKQSFQAQLITIEHNNVMHFSAKLLS